MKLQLVINVMNSNHIEFLRQTMTAGGEFLNVTVSEIPQSSQTPQTTVLLKTEISEDYQWRMLGSLLTASGMLI